MECNSRKESRISESAKKHLLFSYPYSVANAAETDVIPSRVAAPASFQKKCCYCADSTPHRHLQTLYRLLCRAISAKTGCSMLQHNHTSCACGHSAAWGLCGVLQSILELFRHLQQPSKPGKSQADSFDFVSNFRVAASNLSTTRLPHSRMWLTGTGLDSDLSLYIYICIARSEQI